MPNIQQGWQRMYPTRRTRRKIVLRGFTLWFISLLFIAWVVRPEDDDWYEIYKPMVWSIDTAGSYDYRTPIPSNNQREKVRQAQLENRTDDIITDLGTNYAELADAAITRGLPALERLANFSKGLGDATLPNFLTSSRLYRYGERLFADETFKEDIPYIGVLFQGLLQLNYEGKMIPSYNPVTKELTYNVQKFIDIDLVMKLLRDMDYPSAQFMAKYDDQMSFMFNELCKKQIKEHMTIIRDGVEILFDFVYALNNSMIYKRDERFSYQDPDVVFQIRRLQKHCSGNTCLQALRQVLSYLQTDIEFLQPTNCYINDLNYIGDRSRLNPDNPTCWRDQILLKAGIFIQFSLQAILIISVQRHALFSRALAIEQSLKQEIYGKFEEQYKWTLYIADKCLWEQQGESVARERVNRRLDEIWDLEDAELKILGRLPPWATREENIINTVKQYLDVYHSDYRWKPAVYHTNPKDMQIHNFRGAIFYWLNYKKTTLNLLFYGAPMHEYFYGSFNNEYFHEFCHSVETIRFSYLGLDYSDLLGSNRIGQYYYDYRIDVDPPGAE